MTNNTKSYYIVLTNTSDEPSPEVMNDMNYCSLEEAIQAISVDRQQLEDFRYFVKHDRSVNGHHFWSIDDEGITYHWFVRHVLISENGDAMTIMHAL